MLLLLPFASPPPIEPEDVTEAAGELLQNLLSFDWWLQSAGPSILRLAIIIALGVAFRSLLVRASNRLIARVANKQEAEAEGADSATMEIENLRRVQRTKTLGSLFNNIITIVVMGITVLLVLAEFGFNLGPLIAGAGIAGVAIGFGAQSLVEDFLSGIFILMEDQYGVGDVVDVGDATGTVEEVQLRVTKVRAIDGSLWFVRNGQILRVGNMSQDFSKSVLDIGIGYGSDIVRAREVLDAVAHEYATDPRTASEVLEEPTVLGVQELGADSVVLRLMITTRPGQHWAVSRALLERIKIAFDENGIEIPFQQRTVWLRKDESAPDSLAE